MGDLREESCVTGYRHGSRISDVTQRGLIGRLSSSCTESDGFPVPWEEEITSLERLVSSRETSSHGVHL